MKVLQKLFFFPHVGFPTWNFFKFGERGYFFVHSMNLLLAKVKFCCGIGGGEDRIVYKHYVAVMRVAYDGWRSLYRLVNSAQ